MRIRSHILQGVLVKSTNYGNCRPLEKNDRIYVVKKRGWNI